MVTLVADLALVLCIVSSFMGLAGEERYKSFQHHCLPHCIICINYNLQNFVVMLIQVIMSYTINNKLNPQMTIFYKYPKRSYYLLKTNDLNNWIKSTENIQTIALSLCVCWWGEGSWWCMWCSYLLNKGKLNIFGTYFIPP